MFQVDLIADIVGQHKYDLDASMLSLNTPKPEMYCTCGMHWLDDDWGDRTWDLHVAQAILDALRPKTGPIEIDPGQIPLFGEEEKEE